MIFNRTFWTRTGLVIVAVLAVAFLVHLPSMKNFVDLTIGVAWPVTALLVAILFRADIKRLVGRMKKLSKDGAEFGEAPQTVPPGDPTLAGPVAQPAGQIGANAQISANAGGMAKISLDAFVAPAFRPLFNQTVSQLKDRLPAARSAFAESDADIALAWAAELGASVHLERASRSIFQSQIEALNEMKWRPVTKEAFRPFYNRAAERFPAIYTNYSFDQWFSFLIGMGLISGTDDAITVTPAGEAIQMYMAQQKYAAIAS